MTTTTNTTTTTVTTTTTTITTTTTTKSKVGLVIILTLLQITQPPSLLQAYLGPYLVTTLTSLDVYDFSHLSAGLGWAGLDGVTDM